MGLPAKKIITEALQLPTPLRALVAERLIESLDVTDEVLLMNAGVMVVPL